MEPVLDPNIDWYMGVSLKRGVTPRCPFASVELCPRYFQSLSLLGHAGSTKISPDEDDRLLVRWKGSVLWPRIAEYAPSMSGHEGHYTMFSNLCPEIAHDRFGIFASGFGEHADEIDRDAAHQRLAKHKGKSWEWDWAFVRPLHFTECTLYSPLAHGSTVEQRDRPRIEPKEIVTLRPAFMGMSMDIKELAQRFWLLLRKWQGKQP